MDNISTDTMVHICTGCYQRAMMNRPEDREVKIMMLPELVQMACGGI